MHSEDNENTFWTIPIRPDTTAKHVTEAIATKLDSLLTSFLLFELGTGIGTLTFFFSYQLLRLYF